jgi:hypothetical protein
VKGSVFVNVGELGKDVQVMLARFLTVVWLFFFN